ncbi:amidohydrolase family protein, partial [Hymenobacter agri]
DARRRGAGLKELARWLCQNPAKLAGQSGKKGRIAPGFDADLLVLDAEQTFVVREELIQHKHKVSPYLGQELRGVVEMTFLAGELVFQRPDFVRLNHGRFLTR